MNKKVWWGIAGFVVLSVLSIVVDPPNKKDEKLEKIDYPQSTDKNLEKIDYPKNMDRSSSTFEFYQGVFEEVSSPLQVKIRLKNGESLLVHIPLVKVPEPDQPMGREILQFAKKYEGQPIFFYPVYQIKKGEYIGHLRFIKDTYGEELIENGYGILHKEGKYDPTRVAEYMENQKSAQEEKRGLWKYPTYAKSFNPADYQADIKRIQEEEARRKAEEQQRLEEARKRQEDSTYSSDEDDFDLDFDSKRKKRGRLGR